MNKVETYADHWFHDDVGKTYSFTNIYFPRETVQTVLDNITTKEKDTAWKITGKAVTKKGIRHFRLPA